MNEYKELSKLYYSGYNVEEELKKRLDNPCVYKSGLVINPILRGQRQSESFEVFYLPLQEILLLEEEIFINSKEILGLSLKLPGIAKKYAIHEIMINEIIKSNGIEGVHTTKKELYDTINSKKTMRLSGIINKYQQIIEEKINEINSVEEIRKMYDDIFSEDILKNPSNVLDGKLFRKEKIYISDGMSNIHSGDKNEEEIIKHLEELINFMNKKDTNYLIKACISHYFLEYVHPFYDGNGRFGRVLLSTYLSKKLDVFTGLSLSYAIFEEKEKYSKLFLNVSKSNNCGEITFFIKGLFEIIIKGQRSIKEMLSNKILKLEFSEKFLYGLDLEEEENKILYIYIQDFIFSGRPSMKDNDLENILKISRYKLNRYLDVLKEKNYIIQYQKLPSVHMLTDDLKHKFD